MLCANIYNSLNSFAGGNDATVGNILNTLYPNSTDVVGNITVSWDRTQISNATYFQSTFLGQFSENSEYLAFLLDVFGKIFASYSLNPPNGYFESVSEVAKLGDLTFDQLVEQIINMLDLLLYQFLIAAQTYLASCVITIV